MVGYNNVLPQRMTFRHSDIYMLAVPLSIQRERERELLVSFYNKLFIPERIIIDLPVVFIPKGIMMISLYL